MGKVKGSIHYAWFILLGMSILMGLGRGGLNNSGSLYLTPVTDDLGMSMGNLSLYFSVASVITLIGLPIAGKVIAKNNIKFVLIGAIILQAGAYSMFGFMNSVWGWYIFAIPMSFGAIFITQMAGPVLINQWFQKKKGLAIGIMMASSAAIGAFIQPIVGNLIQDNGWRSTYWTIGLAVIIVAVPIILLLIRKPADKGNLPFGAEEEDTNAGETVAHKVEGLKLKEARKTTAFYALIIFFFIITSFGSFAMHIPTFVHGYEYDTAFAGMIMSIYLFGSLFGAIVFGYLSDKIGAKFTAFLALGLGMVTMILLLYFADIEMILKTAFFLFGFVTASIGTLGPLLTSSLFGSKEYSEIYSNASLGLAIAGIVSLPIYGYILDLTNSYNGALYMILGMLVIAIGCIVVAFKSKEKYVNEGLWK